MNRHPVQWLEPVFRFLDALIAEHGHVLFMVFAYVALAAIAWILSGGLRRKRPPQDGVAVIIPIIVIRLTVRPPPLPVIGESPKRGSQPPDDDSSSFAA